MKAKVSPIINFKNTPVKKPISAPYAAFNAPFLSLKLTINSPIKAPEKGPINSPKGPRNKTPIISPIELPIILAFPPPNFFTPNTGIILSRIKIENENLELISGLLLEVGVKFDLRNSLSVPDTSVMVEGDKSYVYKINKENKSKS